MLINNENMKIDLLHLFLKIHENFKWIIKQVIKL